MQYPMDCWANCGADFVVEVAASRGSAELTEGIQVNCTECGEGYVFTVDGDGEPSLDSPDPEQLGENITGHDSERSTHF
jgi:hypothetical protein